MSHIAKIFFKDRNRYWIFVDGRYCTTIRERAFPELNIKVGDWIESCDKLKERDNFFWKNKYGAAGWEAEKVRVQKVESLLTAREPRIGIRKIGFGADTTEYISEHPDEGGKPDLEVFLKEKPERVVLQIEVTGTKIMREAGYRVRPDKLTYAENHADQDVWVILHFEEPEGKFVFIKPVAGKQYKSVEK
jgi:hypothetical protein